MQRQPREKNAAHLAFIRMLPCLVCGNDIQTEAAHVRLADYRMVKPNGFAAKPDDMWTLPLCGNCHRQQHEGNEAEFWEIAGINPLMVALRLYSVSGDYESGVRVVAANAAN
jgi:hypothetical protein